MGVRAGQYAREVERNLAKGKSTEAPHKRAAALSSTSRKADKFDKPSFMDKTILAILKFKKKKTPQKSMTTERTSAITSRLKKAGLSDAEIAKMRGKNK